MEPRAFFERVELILGPTKSADPIGVDYFIQDIEELIEHWHDEDDHERKL